MSQIFIPVGGGGGADLDVITAGAGDVLAGKVTVDREGEPVIGIIPVRGGGTITPGTGNKLAVAAGQYVNDNIVVAGSSNLIPQNIKKGVNIFGVTGIWSGYVTGPEDFYNNGNNPGNFAGHHDAGFWKPSLYQWS